MKCEEYQLLIEEYVDGALDKKAAVVVTSHMATCSRCARFSEALGREREIYARYQRDVEVTPVLWSSIEARINKERVAEPVGLLSRLREAVAGVFAAPRLSPAFAAVLVIVAIGITVAVMTLWNSHGREKIAAVADSNTAIQPPDGGEKNTPSPQPPTSNSPSAPQVAVDRGASSQAPRAGSVSGQRRLPSTAQASPEQLVREAEQKYLAAIAMLSRDVNRHRSQLDPIMLARFDASLSEIDRTIKETRRVVRENPGDPIALQYLLAAYSKKVDVLREMTTD